MEEDGDGIMYVQTAESFPHQIQLMKLHAPAKCKAALPSKGDPIASK